MRSELRPKTNPSTGRQLLDDPRLNFDYQLPATPLPYDHQDEEFSDWVIALADAVAAMESNGLRAHLADYVSREQDSDGSCTCYGESHAADFLSTLDSLGMTHLTVLAVLFLELQQGGAVTLHLDKGRRSDEYQVQYECLCDHEDTEHDDNECVPNFSVWAVGGRPEIDEAVTCLRERLTPATYLRLFPDASMPPKEGAR